MATATERRAETKFPDYQTFGDVFRPSDDRTVSLHRHYRPMTGYAVNPEVADYLQRVNGRRFHYEIIDWKDDVSLVTATCSEFIATFWVALIDTSSIPQEDN